MVAMVLELRQCDCSKRLFLCGCPADEALRSVVSKPAVKVARAPTATFEDGARAASLL